MAAPEICCVLSATAPLPRAQAERLESRGGLKVIEIYGSTETGSLAVRRTAEESNWTPYAGFQLSCGGDDYLADAPHLPAAVPLSDEIDIFADGRFSLLGRTGDMISIRGKRSRVSALNSVLIEAPGISDGTFLHVKRDDSDFLAIVVVPSTDTEHALPELKRAIRTYLLRHVESAFVPRKIVFLESLPRSPTGKIPKDKIAELNRLAGVSK